jgi:thymidylate synthase (FAD)
MKITLLAITPDAQSVIEQAGRTCYLSFDKVNADSAETFISRIIRSGHESVLEHASATFRIKGCSRAMTHQLVRHRLLSFSQQSQRYVEEGGFEYVVPESLPEAFVEDFHADMAAIKDMYLKWRGRGVKREDARFVLPNACCSEVVVSGNFREWRHVIHLRTSHRAQWEIRQACVEIFNVLREHAPACFADLDGVVNNES